MDDYLLFVHAQDVNPIVDSLIKQLGSKGIDCITYKQKLRLARLGSTIIHELEDMVMSAKAVIVVASDDLLDDFQAKLLIDYASAFGNLVSVIPQEFDHVSMPPSFYNGLFLLNMDADPAKFAEHIIVLIEKN